MKHRELNRLFQSHLQGPLRSFTIRGHLIYLEHVHIQLLKAFYFETSSFDSSFTIECFIQPLFIPTDHLVFNYGMRLGRNGDKWFWPDLEARESITHDVLSLIEKQGIPFLDSVSTLSEFVEAIKSRSRSPTLNGLQTIAYSLCYENHDHRAIWQAFSDLKSCMEKNSSKSWVPKMKERTDLLMGIFKEDSNAARELLNEWALETKTKLGLQ